MVVAGGSADGGGRAEAEARDRQVDDPLQLRQNFLVVHVAMGHK